MIAVINNVVAGVGIALLTRFLYPFALYWSAVGGIAGALVLTWLFYAYQRWRFDDYEARARQREHLPTVRSRQSSSRCGRGTYETWFTRVFGGCRTSCCQLKRREGVC